MRKTLIAGAVVVSGIGGALTAVWPAAPVDYQPTVLTEGDIQAEGRVYCTDIKDDWLRKICFSNSMPTTWKMSIIRRTCGEKTAHLLRDPQDHIGNAVQEIEGWRCRTQYSAVNGSDLKDWQPGTRSGTVADAWQKLSYHWQFQGLSRPLDFSRAMAHVTHFSLNK